jgi:kelch-like protein 10
MNLDIPGHIIDLILDYSYTGHCNVTWENIADQYEIPSALHQCFRCLLEELQPENCLGIFKFARIVVTWKEEDSDIFVTTLSKYSNIVLSWKTRLQKSWKILNVRNEELVFEAVIKWTETDMKAPER